MEKDLLARPPWPKLGRRLESLLRKAIYDYEMLDGMTKVAVALSGGKDSLTLLYLLHAISGRGFPPLELHAIHVSGTFSCGAGVLVDSLHATCEKLGVNFIAVEQNQERDKLECYSCSRERRRLIFAAAKKVGVEMIAFGHHRDDHIQTLLMNLLHKGEFAGNLPKLRMHDYGVTILRPLIYISEEEITNFAQFYGFARIMCRCPVGQNSMRKQVSKLLSEIEHLFPNSRVNLAQAGLVYGSDKASRK